MPTAKIVMRTILSVNVLCLMNVYAHAEAPYDELHNQQTVAANTTYNSDSWAPRSATGQSSEVIRSHDGVTASQQLQQRIEALASQSSTPQVNPTFNTPDSTTNMPAGDVYNSAPQTVTTVRRIASASPSAPPVEFPIAIRRMPAPPMSATPMSATPRSSAVTTPATRNNPVSIRTIPSNVNIVTAPQAVAAPRVTPTAASAAMMPVSTLAAASVPMPTVTISDINYVRSVFIPASSYGSEQLDVSLLDDFIKEMSVHARHYPPNFENASEKYYSTKKLEEFEQWIRPYAERPDASYDILLRAAKLNGMARNLDFGSEYAMRGSNYIARALEKQPSSVEANFLYGMMLSEGGGFKEGKKYLVKAANLGYLEAEQSLAQSDLLTDKKGAALQRLQRLQRENPNNSQIQRQVSLIQNGGYYIWDLEE